MRLLVIDDEQLVLEGLEAFLQAALPDVSLDKTASATTALSLASTVPYEVVLLDWNLTDPSTGEAVDPQELVRRLRQAGCDSAIIVVWLIPAMMLGIASGNCTPNSCCQGLAPKALIASITSRSTWRNPRSVRRISGGTA